MSVVHGIHVPGQNGRSVDSPLMFLVGGPGARCIDVEFLAVRSPPALRTYQLCKEYYVLQPRYTSLNPT